ncbi:IS110 family transposase [uncultured Roseobacter sp.]|uniref:IS110 family transposase n=1 Tax=uncultured Roseobacter sp. TaxID=114847 RepID=UPI002603DC1F|nr:IS110 family transposase [uncultured Roseobacter sp.]
MDYSVGLDVSLRSVAVCVIDANGKRIFEHSVACEIEDIQACLHDLPQRSCRIGFESGAMSQHLFFGLKKAGFNVVCMEARQVNAALAAMRNKTDRTDARGIANVLRSGWFNPVHMKSRDAHAVRALLSSRKAVQRKCIDLANEVRGLFRIFGLRLPSRIDQASFDERVRPIIEADPDLSQALLPLLDARAILYSAYRELDRRVKRVASNDEICMRFTAIPGVGPIAALTFRAAVDDPARFSSSRTVAAHFGLTPRRYQSGEMDNRGRISKAGDRDVRSTLYAAANAMMMRSVASSEIKSWGLRLMRRKGRRRAVVAVARKLAVVMHRMWADNTEFRHRPLEAAMT